MKRSPWATVKNLVFVLRYYMRGVLERMRHEEGWLLASGIAFNAVLCTIPILLLFTSFLGSWLHSSELAVEWIDRVVETGFRNQPYAETIKKSIKQIVGDIIAHRASYGLFGAAALTWTGTSLFSSVRSALHRVFRIKSTKNLFLSILEDIVWLLLIGILFVTLNISSWIYKIVENFVNQLPELERFDLSIFEQTIPVIASFLLTLFMFFVVYRFIPDRPPPGRVAWRSALTTALLWEASARLFGWYLVESTSFRELYGTYAFLLVLLVWIYYSSVAFIVGGIIGRLYQERVFPD